MAAFNFRVDAVTNNRGNIKVAYTAGFGALPAEASGQSREASSIAYFQQLGDAVQADLDRYAFDLLVAWIRNRGLTTASDIVGHTISINVTVNALTTSVT